MSQYPSPYSLPQVQMSYAAYDPAQPLLQPSRCAGIMMMSLGGLGVLFGLCMIGSAALLPGMRDQLSTQQLQPLLDLESESGLSASILLYIASGFFILPSILFLALGPFVRKGSSVCTIIALVITSLILIFTLINLVVALVKVSAADACFAFFLNALLGLQSWWLIGAVKNSSRIQYARFAYQMQMYQYQQNAQAYAMGGYPQGYPTSPPPPPAGTDDPNRRQT